MSNVIGTFTRPAPDRSTQQWFPVLVGNRARTETVAIGAESAAATETATGGDFLLLLHATAACWVTIGIEPVAVVGEGWFMDEADILALHLNPGETFAVIAASGG
jgi:hypothetical protein